MNIITHVMWNAYWAVISINILNSIYAIWHIYRRNQEFKKMLDPLFRDLCASSRANLQLAFENDKLTHEQLELKFENQELKRQLSAIQGNN